jgi:hypothetical protein
MVDLRCNIFYESPSFPNFSLPQIPLRDNILRNSLLGFAEGESIFSICFELTRGNRPYLQGEIVSSISFPCGSFAHKVSELLPSRVKAPHEDLGCSWRFHSSVKINSPVAS